MTTARDIVESAAKKIHILGRGQTLDNDEAQDGLEILNDILASMSADTDVVYTQTRETFSLTSAQTYTIGSGGDFNTVRPWTIESIFVSQGSIDYTLNSYGVKSFDEIGFKDVTGTPEYYYYDNNEPLGNLYIYPKPDASYTLTMTSLKPMTEFASLDTVYDMPSLYRKYLKDQLAIEWAPNFEKEASMTVQKEAIKSLNNIRKYNNRNRQIIAKLDNAVVSRGGFDIYSGGYR